MIDGGHHALTECVVEGVVDGLGRDAEARGRVAVNHQRGGEAACLLVARDVLELRERPQFVQHQRCPVREFLWVCVLERVLELRSAKAAIDLQVLDRLQVDRDALQVRQFALEPVDDGLCIGVALVAGLERDGKPAAVGSGVGAIGSDEGRHVVDGWVLQHRVDRRLLQLHHLLERDVRGCLRDSEQQPGVLLWEEALGNDHDEGDGQQERAHRHQKRRELVVEHPAQSPLIETKHRLNAALGQLDQLGTLVERHLVLQHVGAHHRRQREREDRRHDDGHGQGHGEFAKQPTDDAPS